MPTGPYGTTPMMPTGPYGTTPMIPTGPNETVKYNKTELLKLANDSVDKLSNYSSNIEDAAKDRRRC